LSQTKKEASAKETKCRDIQDTLQKENNILEEMLNETENMHLVFLDRDFNFVRVNKAYAKTCGYRPEDMIGKNHFALYPGEDVEAVFKRVRDTGVPTRFHDRPFVFPDQPERGVTFWDWTLKPVKNAAGEVEGLVFSLVDTTERKKAEAELEKSESLYKTLFEKTKDAFQLVEPIYDNEGNAVNYRIIEVNDSYESQVGIKASAVEGKLVTEIDPNIEKNWIETHVAVAKTGNSKRTVIYNGFSKRWYDLFLFPYGKGLVGVLFRDITERKKAEEAITENAQLYTTLFENTEDGFQVVEPIFDKEGNVCDFRYLAANPAFEKQVGVKKSEILGKTAKQVFPTIENYWIEMYSKVLRERKTLHYEDYFDSVKRWYHLFYFLFPNGKIGVLFRDITERKKVEEALRRTEWVARKRAEELENLQVKLEKQAAEVGEYATRMEYLAEERAKKLQDAERLATIGATAGMVGHDIRNPLQAILGDLYLAESDLAAMPASEEKSGLQESLAEIEKNVEYIDKIVHDLQDFAKPLNPVARETDLEEVCNEVLFKSDIEENVEVSYEVQNEARKLVSDPGLLKRILSNLVSNAVQAMPKGGRLMIQGFKDADAVVITVEDTGVGIPEDVRLKLFTPLFTTKAKGQGFGLAVIKRMTDVLGGKVTFESEEGKGTKFSVRLPAAKK
jgi:PAS domain S-box-containing protein